VANFWYVKKKVMLTGIRTCKISASDDMAGTDMRYDPPFPVIPEEDEEECGALPLPLPPVVGLDDEALRC